MRISDWSSDVCSSDLVAERILRIDAGVGEDAVVADAVDLVELGYLTGVLLGPAVIGEPAPGDALHVPAQPDRKSVVKGTSVSVRVDLGGRRSIKNKNTSHKSLTNIYKIDYNHN